MITVSSAIRIYIKIFKKSKVSQFPIESNRLWRARYNSIWARTEPNQTTPERIF